MSQAKRLGLEAMPIEAMNSIYTVGAKPRLRGIPDVIAVAIFVPAAAWLMAHARPGLPTVSATVYSISLVLLFGVSATYHAPMWPMRIRRFWRKLDHSAIYILIAGSYTPICLLLLGPATGRTILWAAWIVAGLGLLKSFLWERAPRWLNTTIYIGVSWLIAPFVPRLWVVAGPWPCLLWAFGGLLYTVGAIIYIRKKPNPYPTLFGYHEIFHVFVVTAGASHYLAMWSLLT